MIIFFFNIAFSKLDFYCFDLALRASSSAFHFASCFSHSNCSVCHFPNSRLLFISFSSINNPFQMLKSVLFRKEKQNQKVEISKFKFKTFKISNTFPSWNFYFSTKPTCKHFFLPRKEKLSHNLLSHLLIFQLLQILILLNIIFYL